MPVVSKMSRNWNRTWFAGCFSIVILGLVIGLSQGCARSEALRRGEGSPANEGKNLPFHTDSVSNSSPETGAPAELKQGASVPFRALSPPRALPAGTLLTVQLQEPLSAAKATAGDQFRALLAAPVTVGSDVVLRSGLAVTGQVESERLMTPRSGRVAEAGYFRLTLTSITIEGRTVPVQTSSLFARGSFQPKGFGMQKGHRLIFRLADPVTIEDARSTATTRVEPSSQPNN